MPILTQEDLAELQQSVRTAVMEANMDAALATLVDAIPTNRPKSNQVLLLAGRMRDIYAYEVGNRLPVDQLDILRNELRHDLLLFVDHLSLLDFSAAAPPRPELRPGHLLYQVPPRMRLREPRECLVRVAHQLSHVLQGLEVDDSISLEEIPVAEVMEVEMIDPCGQEDPAFDIVLLSDAEQVVDAYSYTEWVFSVRPLREGTHRLFLKISVLLTVNGKERSKNIVLKRAIDVSATAPAAPEEEAFTRLWEGDILTEEMAVPPPPPPPPPPAPAPVPAAGKGPVAPAAAKSAGHPRQSKPPVPGREPGNPTPAPLRKRNRMANGIGGLMAVLAVVAVALVAMPTLYRNDRVDLGTGSADDGNNLPVNDSAKYAPVAPPIKEQMAQDEKTPTEDGPGPRERPLVTAPGTITYHPDTVRLDATTRVVYWTHERDTLRIDTLRVN